DDPVVLDDVVAMNANVVARHPSFEDTHGSTPPMTDTRGPFTADRVAPIGMSSIASLAPGRSCRSQPRASHVSDSSSRPRGWKPRGCGMDVTAAARPDRRGAPPAAFPEQCGPEPCRAGAAAPRPP